MSGIKRRAPTAAIGFCGAAAGSSPFWSLEMCLQRFDVTSGTALLTWREASGTIAFHADQVEPLVGGFSENDR